MKFKISGTRIKELIIKFIKIIKFTLTVLVIVWIGILSLPIWLAIVTWKLGLIISDHIIKSIVND